MSSVAAAAELGCRTIALPAISCGIYGYPAEAAARVSIAALARALDDHREIEEAIMVLFGDELLSVFLRVLGELVG